MSEPKYWHDTWIDELIHSKQLQLELGQAKSEIDRLRAIERDRDAVCNSYAAENQSFSDEIDRLRAENEKLKKWRQAYEETWNAERDRLRTENAELLRVATDLRNECYFMGKDVQAADAVLLAKTAKEAD